MPCIKRHSHEYVDDFNIIVEKIWMSIPTRIRPNNAQALVYYRKDFHLDTNMLIFMSEETFLDIYQIIKTIEHTLVSFGKIQPRSNMSLFPNLTPKQAPLPIPHPGVLALLPPPPKPIIQNQVPILLALMLISTSIGSNSQEDERIR